MTGTEPRASASGHALTATFTAFLMAVLVGARRFAHAGLLRGDRALHALLGLERFPTDDTIRNLFRRFGMGQVQRLFEPLAEWRMQRLPQRNEGYTLDLDATVFERYGKQEGSLKRHNPRKHGRPSHHPLLAVLSEAHFLLHGWQVERRFVVVRLSQSWGGLRARIPLLDSILNWQIPTSPKLG